jgi:hypothetical protein
MLDARHRRRAAADEPAGDGRFVGRRQDRRGLPQGKNLVGAFHPPRAVFADTAALRTLPPRELRAGFAK